MPGLSRTSVTVDEAVAILLRLADGPIIFRSARHHPSPEEEDDRSTPDYRSPEEEDALDSAFFLINEYLEEKFDFLKDKLDEAIDDKMVQSEIDSRREALQQHRVDEDLANTYRCAIDDELNRGNTSILKIDLKLSGPGYTYITMTSLDEWFANQRYPVRVLVPATVEVTEGKKKPKVRRRLREQEEAIVAEIKRLGHNPLVLSASQKGKPGVRSKVWAALKGNDLFISYKVFETAWQRARDLGEITEAI